MKRRAGEKFMIGDDIEIEVLEVAGSRVKLGIVAPDSVIIVRKETRITRDENITAARPLDPGAIAALVHRLWHANVKSLTPEISSISSKKP